MNGKCQIPNHKFLASVFSVVERVPRYRKLLNYPREGTERMLRGWIAMDILLGSLGWNSKNVLFGETFDLLLVDDRIRPVLYIETKSFGREIDLEAIPEEVDRILKRTGRRPTLKKMILTNGVKWIVFDLGKAPSVVLEIKDIRKSKSKEVALLKRFLSPSYYVVGANNDAR